jgi:hypothetical protein
MKHQVNLNNSQSPAGRAPTLLIRIVGTRPAGDAPIPRKYLDIAPTLKKQTGRTEIMDENQFDPFFLFQVTTIVKYGVSSHSPTYVSRMPLGTYTSIRSAFSGRSAFKASTAHHILAAWLAMLPAVQVFQGKSGNEDHLRDPSPTQCRGQ